MKKLILFLGVVLLLNGEGVFGQAPCFGDFQYSQTATVSNVSNPALSDFPVRLNLDTQTLISSGKLSPTGDDLRIAGPDCCTPLPYWIQSGLNTPSTTIWVLMDTLPFGGTAEIQLYYGNPGVSGPVSNIDSVMLSIGNDDMGTGSSASGQTIGTTQYRFPVDARTVRWRIFSGDSATLRLKTVDSTDLVKGFSPFFTTSATPGFNTFDWEGPSTVDGYPAWFTADSTLDIMNNCAPVTPCPGSCGDMQYTPGDPGINGNPTVIDSCGATPSMRVWFRNVTGAFFDPVVSANNDELDRQAAVMAAASEPSICNTGSSALTATYPAGGTVTWFRDGMTFGMGDSLVTGQSGDYYFQVQYSSACQVLTSDTLSIAGAASTIDLGPDRTECVDSFYTIDAGPGFVNYLWSDGSTNQTLDIFITGIYWIEAEDANGCIDRDTVIITLRENPVANITPGPDVEICGGSSIMLDGTTPNGFAYEWLPGGETSADLEVDQSGTYQVVVTDANNCVDTSDVVTVTFYPQTQVQLPDDTTLCETDSLVLSVTSIWDSVLWADSSTTSLDFTAFPPGDFWVEVVDTNGCRSRDTIRIDAFSPIVIDLGADRIVCPQNTVTLESATPGAVSYIWNDGTVGDMLVVSAPGGDFSVDATDANGCVSTSTTVNVSFYPESEIPLITREGDVLVSSVTTGSFQWYQDGVTIDGENGTTLNLPSGGGSFFVEVTDVNNCSTLNSNILAVLVSIQRDLIPEGFSPNGDNLNDQFMIPNLDLYPGNSLTIFNRYGSEVFKESPYSNTWQGTWNDQDLPDGTYFYLLDLGGDLEPIQGYVIIQR